MKNLTFVFFMLLIMIAAPAVAATHDHSGHNHGETKTSSHQGHEGHGSAGDMLDLGSVSVKGVKALAEMKDVRASMAKMGMKTTHHFMVMFTDEKTGKAIESGKVAVRVASPDGTVSEATELMGMQGHFGADIVLAEKGKYEFKVGTKLPDGVVRQYEFKYEVK